MSNKLIYLISFVFVLSVALTGTAKADLVGWWKLDEGSGTMAADSSGNGYEGTLGGISTWVAGQHGGAAGVAVLLDEFEALNHPHHGAEKSQERGQSGDNRQGKGALAVGAHLAGGHVTGAADKQVRVRFAVIDQKGDHSGQDRGALFAALENLVVVALPEQKRHLFGQSVGRECRTAEVDDP